MLVASIREWRGVPDSIQVDYLGLHVTKAKQSKAKQSKRRQVPASNRRLALASVPKGKKGRCELGFSPKTTDGRNTDVGSTHV